MRQRTAIDCFARHHCHFKSDWGFDESRPATRWLTQFYPPRSSFFCSQVSRPHLGFQRQGQRAACILMNHLQLSPSSWRGPVPQSHCRAMKPFSSGILWNILGLINMNLWMFNCVYVYRLLSHDQITAICPLIWHNVVDETVRGYFMGNASHGIAAIGCCVIVSDAWIGYHISLINQWFPLCFRIANWICWAFELFFTPTA